MSFYVENHQKLWPRFSVGFPTSNDLDLGWIFYIKWFDQKKKSFTGTSSCVVLVTLDSVKLRTKISHLRTWGQVTCDRFRASERSLCKSWEPCEAWGVVGISRCWRCQSQEITAKEICIQEWKPAQEMYTASRKSEGAEPSKALWNWSSKD